MGDPIPSGPNLGLKFSSELGGKTNFFPEGLVGAPPVGQKKWQTWLSKNFFKINFQFHYILGAGPKVFKEQKKKKKTNFKIFWKKGEKFRGGPGVGTWEVSLLKNFYI